MGVFDEVAVPCPQCGETFWAQSKGGDSSMRHYELRDAPEDVLSDVNRHAPFTCRDCGTAFKVRLGAQVVRV